MTAPDTVSAVIPVFNGDAYVAEAIKSVLAQTQSPVECIVVDDGSTDSTAEVVTGFGGAVKYVRQSRHGVSVARNRGAEIAQGQLVAFLDHDDTWLPAKLERQVSALAEQDATMALCAMEVINSSGTVLGTKRLVARDDLATGMLTFDGTQTVSCSSTGIVHRERFLAMGGFDPELSTSADWDLLLRTLLSGSIAYLDEPLVRYRVHPSNMSRNISRMERDMRHAFAKTFSDPRLPDRLRTRKRHAYGRLYRMLAGSYRDADELRAALRMFGLAVLHDPTVPLERIRRRRS
jgi:glycosyltransferase involved in cell wall biosynthesis